MLVLCPPYGIIAGYGCGPRPARDVGQLVLVPCAVRPQLPQSCDHARNSGGLLNARVPPADKSTKDLSSRLWTI